MIRLAAIPPVLIGLLVTIPLLRFALLPIASWFGPETVPPGGEGPSLLPAIGNSLLLATLTAGCAVPPAIGLGMLLERRCWPGRDTLMASLIMLFLLPGYLLAAGWENVAAAIPPLRPVVLGWPGLVFLSALKAVPVATFAVGAGWTAVQPRLEEATRLHVTSRLRRILLVSYPIAPAAAGATLIVFVESMHDYGLASTIGARLHLSLLVTEVYASLAAWPVSWTRAAVAGDLLMLVALAPLVIRLFAGGPMRLVLERGIPARPRAASVPETAAGLAAVTLVVALGIGVPLLALATVALAGGTVVPPEAWASLGFSAMYAFVASLGALGLACALLATMGAAGRLATTLAWLPLGNIAVPGIVLGAAEVIAFNGGPLQLMGTPLALLLGLVATQYPLLALFLRGPLRAQTALPGDAARVHGVSRLARVERLYVPPLIRPLTLAWAVAFGRTFFELPLAQILAPPGREPVAVVIVQLQQALRFTAEARLALAALIVCAVLVGAVVSLPGRSA